MYVPNHFTEAERFPLMTTTKNLNTIEAVKNKYINGPHAVLAWIGGFLGHTTIADSIKHPELFQFIKEMMEYEIAPILIAEYPDLTSEDLIKLEKSFFERCAASINDPVTRVGRDPLRKLDSGGRIRGTIELARKHDLSIATPRLEKGIAAGLLYALHGVDPSNPGCKKIREIYNQNDSYQSVLCYSGDAPSGKFSGLHPENDSQTIANVLNKMSELNRWKQKFRALARSFLWPIPGQHTGRNQNFEAANMNNSLTMKQ
jgi:mannitol-1-phosphate/altronate dehydrogenase